MKLKDIVANMGDKVARESYGKSTPFFIYEPKAPQALKNALKEKEDLEKKN